MHTSYFPSHQYTIIILLGSQVENLAIEESNNNIEKSSSKKMKSPKFELPPPAKGKTLVDTVINTDIDTLFQVQYYNSHYLLSYIQKKFLNKNINIAYSIPIFILVDLRGRFLF